MQVFSLNTLKCLFKASCFIVAVIMVVYWVTKFSKNEDISTIETTTYEKLENVSQPEFTICMRAPIIDKKLTEISLEANNQSYMDYLWGDISNDEIYKHVDYENVTENFYTYLIGIGIFWRNKPYSSCMNISSCPFVTIKNNWNGFITKDMFFKCYGLTMDTEYASDIHQIRLYFDRSIRMLLEKIGGVNAMFNYQDQLILNDGGDSIWDNVHESIETPWFKIKLVELLKRRNKQNRPCIPNEIPFDYSQVKRHIEAVGCRAPFHIGYKNTSFCQTGAKRRAANYDLFQKSKNYAPPCQVLSTIIYGLEDVPVKKYDYRPMFNVSELPTSLFISYSNKIKVIEQTRLVDGQSLLGYIGGYIGLFLGKEKNINNLNAMMLRLKHIIR